MKYFESLSNFMPFSNAHDIWTEIVNLNLKEKNDRIENIEINTEEYMTLLKKYFTYCMEKNIIIEYSEEKGYPIFSGDSSEIVVDRIFSDFDPKKFPKTNPLDDENFLVYLLLKRGWATLRHGTRVILPE